jgi:hypothetical protein
MASLDYPSHPAILRLHSRDRVNASEQGDSAYHYSNPTLAQLSPSERICGLILRDHPLALVEHAFGAFPFIRIWSGKLYLTEEKPAYD